MTMRLRASPWGTWPDSKGMSRNGSGFRRDQKIGNVIMGPVRSMSMIPQITISSHGLRVNISPCESPGRISLRQENTEYKSCDSAAWSQCLKRDESYFLKQLRTLPRLQPLNSSVYSPYTEVNNGWLGTRLAQHIFGVRSARNRFPRRPNLCSRKVRSCGSGSAVHAVRTTLLRRNGN